MLTGWLTPGLSFRIVLRCCLSNSSPWLALFSLCHHYVSAVCLRVCVSAAAALACSSFKPGTNGTNKTKHRQTNKQRNIGRGIKWPLHLVSNLYIWTTSGHSSAYKHKMWYHLHEVLHHPWEPVHYGISTWCLANIPLCARSSLIQMTAGHRRTLEKDIWPWKSKGCPLGNLRHFFTAY